MYTSRVGLTLGFHGTDEKIVEAVLTGQKDLKPSANSYDWLGNGIYFWDNSPSRALAWATELKKQKESSIEKPAVIGAILDLGYCLDLLDYKNLALLKMGHDLLKTSFRESLSRLPSNSGASEDLPQRDLDCAVIETLHESLEKSGNEPFDSTRGVFWEGKTLFPKAGFREKNHIQICIRNLNCIKGYFLPLERMVN